MIKLISVLILNLIITQISFADTHMIIKFDDGNSDIWLNEKYARIAFTEKTPDKEDPAPPGDMISSFSSGKTYLIDDKNKTLIDMSSPAMFLGEAAPVKNSPDKLNITYKNRGKGELIAGLNTTKYEIIVKGKKCFEMMLTTDKAYGHAMKKLKSLPENNDGTGGVCEQAGIKVGEGKKHGYPVKSINASGELDMLLLEFKTSVKAQKKHLSFPADYKVKTMTEIIQDAMAKQLTQQPQ